MKKKFYAFLKDNNCLFEYLLNLSANHRTIKQIHHCSSYISGAFPWNKTTEGLDFWSLLENKWQLIVNK